MTLKPSIWTKSSYSGNEGPACVEVAWFKSSHSSNDEPNCVEVAATPGLVHVRDSKNVPGPQLAFPEAQWAQFIASGLSRA
ncbi:DUF397 domain-containing protein [Streptomyces sp. HNM0663]|uniref:DUF397 domain-containing protein n=1 Tax=Streptomyces chengmaiensis TaxID=3040919 RepID=A0ABT6HJT3_9ACTN|nr:DUF397 domain-containing protein [Streptomyces chengmaiensis]MDH2389009.1 DUF397 domain-containing protein [Streptomyces chengmaiensis]